MKIKKLHIENYKSIKDLVIENPNPFSVFVGPNGAGKSNIFEALEFAILAHHSHTFLASKTYGGLESVLHVDSIEAGQLFELTGERDNEILYLMINYGGNTLSNLSNHKEPDQKPIAAKNLAELSDSGVSQFIDKHSRIFLNNSSLKKINTDDDSALNLDGSNIEKVLSRILQNKNNREEIIEWLQVLIPEFKDIQIETSGLSGDVSYAIFEKHTNKPFPKHLISDGTKNILALLTAVYQSDEPQFLCIEEPENGLHPHVIRELVSLFRNACKEKGHYIWLNTHSETLVRQLTADEIIVVDKKNGATNVRQFKGENLFGLKMDEAWLTNALGGGLP